MHALVTGGGGFLGRYIVERLLARGDCVRSFGRGTYPELQEQGVEVVRGDIRDEKAVREACRGVDTVFHVAALPGIQCQWLPFYETNTLGTQYVLRGCLEHEVPRLVYTSSPSVVFAGKAQVHINESTPYPQKWLAHYPHSKALGEQMVLKANGTPLPRSGNQLLTCSVRPHLLWGPRDQHLIPRLFQRYRSGKLRIVGDGTNLIDQLYIENAAQGHVQAADALVPGGKVAGKAYFLSQGEPLNCWQWINELLEIAGYPPVTRRVSFRLAWNVGAILEAFYHVFGLKGEPVMTRFLAGHLALSHTYDTSAAREDFGFVPEISTAEGMDRIKASLKGI